MHTFEMQVLLLASTKVRMFTFWTTKYLFEQV